ncbi:MAG: glycosyltransferase [Chlamydiota bacterium]
MFYTRLWSVSLLFFLALFGKINQLYSLETDSEMHHKICLNMIVKNESHVIKRCLDSVKNLIDYWMIIDTGSTDDTKKIILEELKDIPGQLIERPWKDFGYNRTEALILAKNKAEYLLFIDADDALDCTEDFALPDLTYDAYVLPWVHKSHFQFSYLKPQLVKASLPWHWVGVLHEYLICDRYFSQILLENIRYIYGNDGARSQDPHKYKQACKILEEGLKEEPNNSRYLFYLAESYRCANKKEKALVTYQKSAAMKGWEEEIYWSLLQVAHLQKSLSFPKEEIIKSYLKAFESRPHRPEAVYFLAEMYNQNKQFKNAYHYIKQWLLLPQPEQKDALFSLDWIEQFGLTFQLSICSYYLGFYQESLEACDLLLEMDFLPESFKNQTISNRAFPLQFCKN